MATTLTLPYKRFVAQVNTGAPEAKANYKALAQRNALALESCPWHDAAGDTVRPSLVEHDFTATFADEKYDAFCMTGSYNSASNTEIAYAGMVAYRFKLPQAYLSGNASLVSASVMLSRDRFLLPGLRVSAVLSDAAIPSADWSVVRGDAEGCVKLAAQLSNPAERITAAEQATEAVSVDLAGMDATKRTYLWIYLSVEDYAETWTWYSSSQHRLYAIEGSGMVISQSTTVEFSGDVAPDGTSADGVPVLCGGVLPYVGAGSPVGERYVLVRADSNLVVEADGVQTPQRVAEGVAAASALSRAYAIFYAGGGEMPLADGASSHRGASFTVTRAAMPLPTAESDEPQPTDAIRIDASALVVPFTWPRDAVPSKVRLSFAELSLPLSARINVFLAADKYLTALSEDQLKSPGLWDGDSDAPFKLLGTIRDGTTAEFDVPAGTGRVGTLVITAWIPPEAYSIAIGGTQGTGAAFLPDVSILLAN